MADRELSTNTVHRDADYAMLTVTERRQDARREDPETLVADATRVNDQASITSDSLEHPVPPVRGDRPLLGQISFINALPVVLPIEEGTVPLWATCVAAPPGTLNTWLKEKRLDAGAMSAFFYLEHAGELELFDGLAISSKGAVGSVLLFCAGETDELKGCDIAVPDSSASSINLLRVLLKEVHGIEVNLVPYRKPDFRAAERGGLLLFGDKALTSDLELSMRYNRIDLGKWWHDLSGLPMVYGVWGACREFVSAHEDHFLDMGEALCAARDEGLGASFPRVLAEAQRRTGLPLGRLEQYYCRDLDFFFNDAHKEGLRLYETLCRKHGLIGD